MTNKYYAKNTFFNIHHILVFFLILVLLPKYLIAANVEDVAELNKNLINIDFESYGYIFGQEYSVLFCSQKCPNISRELLYYNNKIMSKYQKAIDRIRSRYGTEIDFSKYDLELVNELKKKNHFSSITCDDCSTFIAQLKSRSEGDIPNSIHAGLARNIPEYRAHPEVEFSDGIVKEWKSSDNKKLLGLDVSILYPASWKAKDGRGPHIVKKFTSDYGFGLVTFMIQVRDISDLGISDLPKGSAKELLAYITGFTSSSIPGSQFFGRGEVVINNHDAIYLEFNMDQKAMDKTFKAQSIMYYFIAGGNIVQLQGIVGLPKTENTSTELSRLYKKYSPVFVKMANSFYVNNQFQVQQNYESKPSTYVYADKTEAPPDTSTVKNILISALGLLLFAGLVFLIFSRIIKTRHSSKTSPTAKTESNIDPNTGLATCPHCGKVILPFLVSLRSRGYAAVLNFCIGVMPPMAMFGRSLLYIQSHLVAKSWTSSIQSNRY